MAAICDERGSKNAPPEGRPVRPSIVRAGRLAIKAPLVSRLWLRFNGRGSSQRATRVPSSAKMLRAARFPAVKSLDTFDFTASTSLNKTLVLELARCEYPHAEAFQVLIPYEFICKCWTKEPQRFTSDPHHQILGPNI